VIRKLKFGDSVQDIMSAVGKYKYTGKLFAATNSFLPLKGYVVHQEIPVSIEIIVYRYRYSLGLKNPSRICLTPGKSRFKNL
jgi:hypothetical protein